MKMREQIKADAVEMLEAAGLTNVKPFDYSGGIGVRGSRNGHCPHGSRPKNVGAEC